MTHPAYEEKSGALIAPGIPEVAEHELMEQIESTYSKVIHTWHTGRGLKLPMGIPQIRMGFTKEDQLNAKLRLTENSGLKLVRSRNASNEQVSYA